jgi:hypothetical protein
MRWISNMFLEEVPGYTGGLVTVKTMEEGYVYWMENIEDDYYCGVLSVDEWGWEFWNLEFCDKECGHWMNVFEPTTDCYEYYS